MSLAQPSAREGRMALGILYKLCAIMSFMIMASFVKAVAPRIPPMEAVFFRSLFGIPLILLWIGWQRPILSGIRAKNKRGHLLRGLLGAGGVSCGFAALGLLPLSEVKSIQYAQPVILVLLAAIFLRENVRLFRMSAVCLGLTGVLIIMWPRLTAFTDIGADRALAFGALLAFGSALFAGFAHMMIRKLTEEETTTSIVFWAMTTSLAISAVTMPFFWISPTGIELAMLFGASFAGTVGQMFVTMSYREADASVVAPFEYTSILFALGIGYFIFDEVPTRQMIIGSAVVICAGIMILWRERHLGLRGVRNFNS